MDGAAAADRLRLRARRRGAGERRDARRHRAVGTGGEPARLPARRTSAAAIRGSGRVRPACGGVRAAGDGRTPARDGGVRQPHERHGLDRLRRDACGGRRRQPGHLRTHLVRHRRRRHRSGRCGRRGAAAVGRRRRDDAGARPRGRRVRPGSGAHGRGGRGVADRPRGAPTGRWVAGPVLASARDAARRRRRAADVRCLRAHPALRGAGGGAARPCVGRPRRSGVHRWLAHRSAHRLPRPATPRQRADRLAAVCARHDPRLGSRPLERGC